MVCDIALINGSGRIRTSVLQSAALRKRRSGIKADGGGADVDDSFLEDSVCVFAIFH